jgi:Domain of unknown function (DUF4168)
MKLPHLLQVSLLLCVASVVASTQQSVAATNNSKIDVVRSLASTKTIQVSDIFVPQPVRVALAVTDGELRKYAMAIIEIEPLRIEALQAIKSRVSGGVPSLMCHQPGNLDSLPADARRIFVKHCDRASSIAAKHGLSMDSFNRITAAVSADGSLRGRLQSLVNRLQGG